MMVRTMALAALLALGLGSTAMAQSIHVDTPGFGLSFGAPYHGPDHYSFAHDEDYYGYGGGYAHTSDVEAYAYTSTDEYVAGPVYGYRSGWPSRRGDRADERIYSGGVGGPYLQDDYNNQTGINNN